MYSFTYMRIIIKSIIIDIENIYKGNHLKMNKLSYVYESIGKKIEQYTLYEGERVLFKNENIKFEDE